MGELFLSVLNMSLTASYVIIVVILIRLLLKKAPKVISYALWGVVAFRLTIPFSFESIFSLMPRNTNAIPIPHDIIYQQNPQINSGIEVVDSFVSQSLPAPTVGASVNPLQVYIEIGAYIWILGMIALLVYSLASVLILNRQLKSAQLIKQNTFEVQNLKTPFVLGLIKPKIYLPVGLNSTERSYILLHEQTHIHRKDHIIKILAFLILSIHWFNPLVWVAFILMSTDMELSCDEKVLKEMDGDIKKTYANTLLSLATERHILNGSPLAFGEGNVKGRIKNVLNYKKPRFLVIVLSIIIVIAIGIGLMANPVNTAEPLDSSSADELWKSATKYIGDNSAVGKLISLLTVPEYVGYDHFELHTSERPYDIEMVYSVSSEVLKQYDTEEALEPNPFQKNALILLALVDNADGIRTVLTDGDREVEFIATREWADDTVGEDIRNYAESPEKLQELMELPLAVTESKEDIIIDIGQSTKFTEEEITKAIDTVKNNFNFKGCTLTKLWYDEEKSNYFSKAYLGTGKGSVNDVEAENVIVLLSNFDVDSSGGDGSFEPNSTYGGWQWVLIRDSKANDWEIDTWGY